MTLGEHGHPGDWNEAKGQRYLWQPLAVAFAKDGSAYIGEGHANESPNDVGSDDPTNRSGAARIIHVTKDGKFIAQWYGDVNGQGKFFQAHDVAVDPQNGDVWIGDREEYRLVVYTAEGQFVKTIQMRNLTCNIAFDPRWPSVDRDRPGRPAPSDRPQWQGARRCRQRARLGLWPAERDRLYHLG